MEEIWKFIEGYDDAYRVSNFGRVQSCKNNKWGKTDNWRDLKLTPNNHNYLDVKLSIKSNVTTFLVHKLVALGFLDNHHNYTHINHIDLDRRNNIVYNLEWVSQRENNTHGHTSKVNKSSKYIGATWCKNHNRWLSRITVDGRSIHLGSFLTDVDAHNAYLSAMEKYGIVNKYAKTLNANYNTSLETSVELPSAPKECK